MGFDEEKEVLKGMEIRGFSGALLVTSNDLNTWCSTIKKHITLIEADPIYLDKSIICI